MKCTQLQPLTDLGWFSANMWYQSRQKRSILIHQCYRRWPDNVWSRLTEWGWMMGIVNHSCFPAKFSPRHEYECVWINYEMINIIIRFAFFNDNSHQDIGVGNASVLLRRLWFGRCYGCYTPGAAYVYMSGTLPWSNGTNGIWALLRATSRRAAIAYDEIWLNDFQFASFDIGSWSKKIRRSETERERPSHELKNGKTYIKKEEKKEKESTSVAVQG